MQTPQEIVWPETSALHSKLTKEIMEEEIKVIVWGMEPSKDPWLDGFNNPFLSITLEYLWLKLARRITLIKYTLLDLPLYICLILLDHAVILN